MSIDSPYLSLLKNRINLRRIPFSDRSSRILVYRSENAFRIRLAERWLKLDARLSAYRDRPPLISNWVLTDGEGNPLDIDLTTYPHGLECSTSVGLFTLAFADPETLVLTLPPASCGIKFDANLDQARFDRRGGILRLTGDIRRNVAYTTNAPILKNETLSIDAKNQSVQLLVDARAGNQAIVLNITPRLGFNRYILGSVGAMQASARRWHEWFAAAPAVADPYREQYYYAWWVMRAGLISTRFYMTREAMAPSMSHYVGVWQWDAYFHALAYRHIDKRLAQDQFRIMLDHQREDGMIPDAVHDEGVVTHMDVPVDADVTKPPLLAWAAWKLYEQDGDAEFLNEIYEPAVRWNRWWYQHNDLDGDGLCEYLHPFSSGLDDSPLWDDGVPVQAPDLNTYLVLQQEALSRIAAVIGEKADAQMWEQRAQETVERMVGRSWDAESGTFCASCLGSRVDVRTPFGLFPLITGRLPAEISSRLVAHLTDEREFWPRYPVPTVALNDPKYSPNQMWRGPVWINVNYLLIEGLQRSGYPEVAAELRKRTLELVCGRDDIYEYYHPETGENPPLAATTFGWSAAMFIDLAIQASRDPRPA
ncbi:MAG TPA: trehalase family glycosidase [Anaerolineales bacterium]|nr:trehalase family glycosidase [Anaerolineales bacterium]